jgi:hypothetical protein
MEEKQYEFRNLESRDIFSMINLINAFGIENFKTCLSFDVKSLVNENGDLNTEQLKSIAGLNIIFDVVSVICKNLGNCENEIYKFLESVSNLKAKDIKTLPADVFLNMLVDFFKKDEFVGFFKAVLKLLNLG